MILLDTHALVWVAIENTGPLPQSVLDGVNSAVIRGEAAVSAATFWELALLRRKFRRGLPALPPTDTLRSAMLDLGLREEAVSGALWIDAVGLADEGFHQDPADQIIMATAIRRDHELLTCDRRMSAWARRTGRVTLYDTTAVP